MALSPSVLYVWHFVFLLPVFFFILCFFLCLLRFDFVTFIPVFCQPVPYFHLCLVLHPLWIVLSSLCRSVRLSDCASGVFHSPLLDPFVISTFVSYFGFCTFLDFCNSQSHFAILLWFLSPLTLGTNGYFCKCRKKILIWIFSDFLIENPNVELWIKKFQILLL